jgi:hypothetical protein
MVGEDSKEKSPECDDFSGKGEQLLFQTENHSTTKRTGVENNLTPSSPLSLCLSFDTGG